MSRMRNMYSFYDNEVGQKIFKVILLQGLNFDYGLLIIFYMSLIRLVMPIIKNSFTTHKYFPLFPSTFSPKIPIFLPENLTSAGRAEMVIIFHKTNIISVWICRFFSPVSSIALAIERSLALFFWVHNFFAPFLPTTLFFRASFGNCFIAFLFSLPGKGW